MTYSRHHEIIEPTPLAAEDAGCGPMPDDDGWELSLEPTEVRGGTMVPGSYLLQLIARAPGLATVAAYVGYQAKGPEPICHPDTGEPTRGQERFVSVYVDGREIRADAPPGLTIGAARQRARQIVTVEAWKVSRKAKAALAEQERIETENAAKAKARAEWKP